MTSACRASAAGSEPPSTTTEDKKASSIHSACNSAVIMAVLSRRVKYIFLARTFAKERSPSACQRIEVSRRYHASPCQPTVRATREIQASILRALPARQTAHSGRFSVG